MKKKKGQKSDNHGMPLCGFLAFFVLGAVGSCFGEVCDRSSMPPVGLYFCVISGCPLLASSDFYVKEGMLSRITVAMCVSLARVEDKGRLVSGGTGFLAIYSIYSLAFIVILVWRDYCSVFHDLH